MGTLVFFPWATVQSRLDFGDFALVPVRLEEGRPPRRGSGAWLPATEDMKLVLGAYREPPDFPIPSATLIQVSGKELGADLSDEEIGEARLFAEVVVFAALCERDFFAGPGRAYFNRDSLVCIGQRYRANEGGAAITSRRRDGSNTTLVPAEFYKVRRDFHVESLRPFTVDATLVKALRSRISADSDCWLRAIEAFNRANTDSPAMTPALEVIDMVSALQRLFKVGSKCEQLADALADALSLFPSAPPEKVLNHDGSEEEGLVEEDEEMESQPKLRTLPERILKKRFGSIRKAWAYDLCSLRGNLGHGYGPSAYRDACWTMEEHLLLAAFLFPLVVKVKIAISGERQLTAEEQFRLRALDLYLHAADIMKPLDDLGGSLHGCGWNAVTRWARFRV